MHRRSVPEHLRQELPRPLIAGGFEERLRLRLLDDLATKQLILCGIERRPPRLDLAAYPYLPKANVAMTRAADYAALLEGAAA